MKVNSIPLKLTSSDKSFWRGISDSHDTIQYMLCELCDDSISSIISSPVRQKKILITISEITPEKWSAEYQISVEDTGSGILDLSACLSYANTSGRQSPLNRYGVALKKVLATFDPSNRNWKICTRTEEEYQKNQFRLVEAPYSARNKTADLIQDEPWPGSFTESGTIITFPCSKELLATAGKEYPGSKRPPERLLSCISEELSVVYAPILESDVSIDLRLITASNRVRYYEIKPLRPLWKEIEKADCGEEVVDLGRGGVRIKYHFGVIENHPSTSRYYRKNIASSGVMVYENGRLIESNVFKAIWSKVHPAYNAFLVVLELTPFTDPEALPQPTPTKDGLFYGDDRVTALYEWIRQHCPSPGAFIKNSGAGKEAVKEKERTEAELRQKLVDILREEHGDEATVRTDFPLYCCIEKSKPMVDIFLSDGIIALFECKSGISHPKDLFQLMMYHMGALHDGYNPSHLILVADRHPESTKKIAEYLSSCKAPDGQVYDFSLKTWMDYGITPHESNQ